MKKITYLFAALIMVAALGSCEKDNSGILLKESSSDTGLSLPVSNGPDGIPGGIEGITPEIIEGSSQGGNRTCAEVAEWFDTEFDWCGDKVNYSDGQFDNSFPAGLNVTVTVGTYVAFEVPDYIMIGDKYYKVGAVIVKGSNEANVYFYPDGSFGDSGLAAPLNASGMPAGLSNLSFCLVEVEPNFPEVVIALKTYLANPVDGEVVTYVRNGWAVSGGLGVSTERGLHMGYNYYDFNGENEFDLVRATLDAIIGPIGTIKATDYWEEGIHYLEVVLDLDDVNFVFDDTYLYVGSLEGYEGRWYKLFPFTDLDNFATQRVFKIDFATILL
jgi:hypothetical protein